VRRPQAESRADKNRFSAFRFRLLNSTPRRHRNYHRKQWLTAERIPRRTDSFNGAEGDCVRTRFQ
jgi:hypothetical protein